MILSMSPTLSEVSVDAPVRLRVLMSALEARLMKPIVADLRRAVPSIVLEIVEAPNATNLVEDMYSSAFLLGSSPYDIVYMDVIWAPKFAGAGWLADLSDLYSDDQLADFLEGDLKGGMVEGKLYRVPFRSDGGALYYRTDVLERLGFEPPETTNELEQQALAAIGAGEVSMGFLWQGKQYEGLSAMFVEVLEAFNGYWINPNTFEVGLSEPEAIAAAKWLKGVIAKGVSPQGVSGYAEEEVRRLFQGGVALFMRNWPYAWRPGQSLESPVRGKFGIVPMVKTATGRHGACQGGWGFGVSKASPYQEQARAVIRYLTSPQTQKRFTIDYGYIPARKQVFNDPEVQARYPYLASVRKALETAVLRPPIPQYSILSDILQRYLSAILFTGMEAQDGFVAATRESRAVLRMARTKLKKVPTAINIKIGRR